MKTLTKEQFEALSFLTNDDLPNAEGVVPEDICVELAQDGLAKTIIELDPDPDYEYLVTSATEAGYRACRIHKMYLASIS